MACQQLDSSQFILNDEVLRMQTFKQVLGYKTQRFDLVASPILIPLKIGFNESDEQTTLLIRNPNTRIESTDYKKRSISVDKTSIGQTKKILEKYLAFKLKENSYVFFVCHQYYILL